MCFQLSLFLPEYRRNLADIMCVEALDRAHLYICGSRHTAVMLSTGMLANNYLQSYHTETLDKNSKQSGKAAQGNSISERLKIAIYIGPNMHLRLPPLSCLPPESFMCKVFTCSSNVSASMERNDNNGDVSESGFSSAHLLQLWQRLKWHFSILFNLPSFPNTTSSLLTA